MAGSRAFAFIVKEFEEVLPPVLFFVVGFNLVEFTTQLVLDDYLARFANYLVATMAALVVRKAVLLANLLCHSSAALTRHLSSNRFCSRPSSTLLSCSWCESWRRSSNTGSVEAPWPVFRTTWRTTSPGIGTPRFRYGSSFCSFSTRRLPNLMSGSVVAYSPGCSSPSVHPNRRHYEHGGLG
jgi:hypothetical protein